MEKLERRTAEMLYKKQEWFKWVRELEDEEENDRDAEKKKVKQEAALFKRHWAEVQTRLKRLRAKEDRRMQNEYLDKAWEERQKMSMDDDTEDEDWDPIEDTVEDERGSYIDLIRHFLWQEGSRDDHVKSDTDESHTRPVSSPTAEKCAVKQNATQQETADKGDDNTSKSKAAKKRARQKANAAAKQGNDDQKTQDQGNQPKPGEIHVETPAEMRRRLSEGQTFAGGVSRLIKGTIENPVETQDKTAPVPHDEVDVLLKQIVEIKQLLFCRLLLAHAALLPAALKANSIEEFLADEGLTNNDLRDLCLRTERSGLQELRDACADLGRDDMNEGDDEDADMTVAPLARTRIFPHRLFTQKQFQTDREKSIKASREKSMPEGFGEKSSTFVDFGDIDDNGQYRIKKIRVKVCGRWI